MEITQYQLDHINKMLEEVHMGLHTIKLYLEVITSQDKFAALLEKMEKPKGDK